MLFTVAALMLSTSFDTAYTGAAFTGVLRDVFYSVRETDLNLFGKVSLYLRVDFSSNYKTVSRLEIRDFPAWLGNRLYSLRHFY